MKSNFRTAMKAKSLPWKNLTKELIDKNTVTSEADFQFGLLQYLNNMAEFSIDPKGVEMIPNRKLEKVFDDRKGDIAKLMGIVAPSCKRMLLVCRYLSVVFSFFMITINLKMKKILDGKGTIGIVQICSRSKRQMMDIVVHSTLSKCQR